jgi:hypothetical protein
MSESIEHCDCYQEPWPTTRHVSASRTHRHFTPIHVPEAPLPRVFGIANGFIQSLQANAAMVPRTHRDRSLPNHSQFMTNQSFYHVMLYSLTYRQHREVNWMGEIIFIQLNCVFKYSTHRPPWSSVTAKRDNKTGKMSGIGRWLASRRGPPLSRRGSKSDPPVSTDQKWAGLNKTKIFPLLIRY